MKQAADAIDKLISHMGKILRYVAPGFASLFVIAAAIPKTRPWLSSGSPSVVVLGMLLGPTIYAVHTGALIRCLWNPIILRLREVDTWKGTRKKVYELGLQRWLRRASEEREVSSIQGEMDEWGAMLNFLYCLSYTMIFIPCGAKLIQCRIVDAVVSPTWIIILLMGLALLGAALISECRIIRMEIRLGDKYPDGKMTKQ